MAVVVAVPILAEAAETAVKHCADFAPFVVPGPVQVRLTFIAPSYADVIENLDDVQQVYTNALVDEQ